MCGRFGLFARLDAIEDYVDAPLGWDRERIRAYLRGTRDVGLAAFERSGEVESPSDVSI